MKHAIHSVTAVVLLVLLVGVSAATAQNGEPQAPEAVVGTAFTFQGRIVDNGVPANGTLDFQFRLYNAATAGSQIGSTVTKSDVPVSTGQFSVDLDFGGNIFRADARWLEMSARPGASTGAYTILGPRQRLNPTPYAMALPGLWTQQNATSANVLGGYTGNSVTANAVGSVISGGGNGSSANRVTDSYGTVSGGAGNLAGSDDTDVANATFATVGGGSGNTAAAEATVAGGIGNQATGVRASVAGGSYNVASGEQATVAGGNGNRASGLLSSIGGGNLNIASADHAIVAGGASNTASAPQATVGGGQNNTASADQATVGGGSSNTASQYGTTVAGGIANQASNGWYSTVGGGWVNTASAQGATVSGGMENSASGGESTVAGGRGNGATGSSTSIAGGRNNQANGQGDAIGGGAFNVAAGTYATVGGGQQNTASGNGSTVPGGQQNTASGDQSFAAGYRAKADYPGCFVWGDSSEQDVTCGLRDRFIARASGGFYLMTNASASVGAWLPSGSGSWMNLSDRASKENVRPVDGQALLDRLAAVSVSTWNYKTQDAAVRHIGPMAQDFYAAFGVGEDDKHISTIDAEGVALAASQALYALAQEQQRQLTAQQARIDQLEQENSALETRIDAIERTLSGRQLTQAPIAGGFVPLGGLLVAGLATGWLARRRSGAGHQHGGEL